MYAIRARLEQSHTVVKQQTVALDQARQHEALLLAQVESFAGCLSGMANMLSEMGVSMNEQKSRLHCINCKFASYSDRVSRVRVCSVLAPKVSKFRP